MGLDASASPAARSNALNMERLINGIHRPGHDTLDSA